MTHEITTPMNNADIDAAIATVHGQAETVQMNIQRILCGILAVWIKTGDNRYFPLQVNSLLDGMPKGIRANAIREWCTKHLGMVYNPVNKAMVAGDRKAADCDLKAAIKQRWFTMKQEPEFEAFDLEKALGKFIEKATKRAQGAKEGDNIDPVFLAALRSTLRATPAERLAMVKSESLDALASDEAPEAIEAIAA